MEKCKFDINKYITITANDLLEASMTVAKDFVNEAKKNILDNKSLSSEEQLKQLENADGMYFNILLISTLISQYLFKEDKKEKEKDEE